MLKRCFFRCGNGNLRAIAIAIMNHHQTLHHDSILLLSVEDVVWIAYIKKPETELDIRTGSVAFLFIAL
jgi:hypothetical protein